MSSDPAGNLPGCLVRDIDDQITNCDEFDCYSDSPFCSSMAQTNHDSYVYGPHLVCRIKDNKASYASRYHSMNTKHHTFVKRRYDQFKFYLGTTLKMYSVPNCRFFVGLHDNVVTNVPTFSVYRSPENNNLLTVPEYKYLHDLPSFKVSESVPEFSDSIPKFFFRGAVKENNWRELGQAPRNLMRRALFNLTNRNPDIYDMWQTKASGSDNMVPMNEFGKYAFIINVRGVGPWADRHPFILGQKSVVVNIISRLYEQGRFFWEPLAESGVTHLDVKYPMPSGDKWSLDGRQVDILDSRLQAIHSDFTSNAEKYADIAGASTQLYKDIRKLDRFAYLAHFLERYSERFS